MTSTDVTTIAGIDSIKGVRLSAPDAPDASTFQFSGQATLTEKAARQIARALGTSRAAGVGLQRSIVALERAINKGIYQIDNGKGFWTNVVISGGEECTALQRVMDAWRLAMRALNECEYADAYREMAKAEAAPMLQAAFTDCLAEAMAAAFMLDPNNAQNTAPVDPAPAAVDTGAMHGPALDGVTAAYAALVAFCEDTDNPANSVAWLAEYDRLNAAYQRACAWPPAAVNTGELDRVNDLLDQAEADARDACAAIDAEVHAAGRDCETLRQMGWDRGCYDEWLKDWELAQSAYTAAFNAAQDRKAAILADCARKQAAIQAAAAILLAA